MNLDCTFSCCHTYDLSYALTPWILVAPWILSPGHTLDLSYTLSIGHTMGLGHTFNPGHNQHDRTRLAQLGIIALWILGIPYILVAL